MHVDRIAIIGAGPSGLAAAKYFTAEKKFSRVQVYEQRNTVGGVWAYNPIRTIDDDFSIPRPSPTKIPSTTIKAAGYDAVQFVTPVYDELETNVAHSMMNYSDHAFPDDTSLFPRHEAVNKYLQQYAEDIKSLISLSTQVLRAEKRSTIDQTYWEVETVDLTTNKKSTENFQAVFVASGHYNDPFVPDIQGLAEYNAAHPDSVSHSKYYKSPSDYKDKKVIVVGNSASGLDISTQIAAVSKLPVLVSERSTQKPKPAQARPPWAKDVGEIVEFIPSSRSVRMNDGTFESDIDIVMFCTGYFYSYSFLLGLSPPVVTDGAYVHNLYQHLLYMDDPTLAFAGVPQRVIPFPFAESQAAWIARLWSGRSLLPSLTEMKEWEARRLREKGRLIHNLAYPQDADYINLFYEKSLQADKRPGLENDGLGKVPPYWDEEKRWVREHILMAKVDSRKLGDKRHDIKTLQQLGYDYNARKAELELDEKQLLMVADIRVDIDLGGTFCDVIAQIQGRKPIVFKLLSEDPANYADAPTEAIRRVLEQVEQRSIPVGEKLDGSRIASCRIGTTVATNALLGHKGERFALITTKGFKDACVIGDQSRPEIFNLSIRKATALHSKVVEIEERIVPADYDLNPTPYDTKVLAAEAESSPTRLQRTVSGDYVRILREPDADTVRAQLRTLQDEGFTALAICFMHAYLYPAHEDFVANIAKEIGFDYISKSSRTSPTIKFLNRSTSTCSEAYLYPVVKRYIKSFEAGFRVQPQRVDFMCSDGGLKTASKFRGNEALVSGPAGGVVGVARSCYDPEEGTPVIGFDMGGTSTDVSRYDGKFDFLSETVIAGRTITVPMLNIATVAAGGGSILFARNGLLIVGPESAGAHPGPACYRKGGPLTVTDAKLFLGRLVLSSFPSIFGPNANETLDTEIVKHKFQDLTAAFNAQTNQSLSPETVALGFLDIANETMSRPIRNATEARGFAPEKHNLVCFGGAGGQHACDIADKLGIKRILIHKWSSLLSANGIAQADLQYEALEPFGSRLNDKALAHISTRLDVLKAKVARELQLQSADEASITFDKSLVLRYFGTNTDITITKPEDDGDYSAAFEANHHREFGFFMKRDIVVEAIKPVFIEGAWHDTGIYHLKDTPKGVIVVGPALLIDETQTIFVSPTFRAYILSAHTLLEKIPIASNGVILNSFSSEITSNSTSSSSNVDPILLSVFSHRFMAIAEQMGTTLQRTSISTSIKERLDFSCAIFSSEGRLVANAPHIPIHLGSMQFAIQAQHRHWADKLQPGDVVMTNHPQWGGTHLPDITVVTPVFIDESIAFYVASRGHHTDIGGKGITSMAPESKELWEEGLNVTSMKIVSGGEFLEDDVRAAFNRAGSFPGCSPTRRIADNISDLRAQTSANQRGITLLRKLCEEATLPVVHKYVNSIQDNAELAVRSFFKQFAASHPEPLEATDFLDDGTPMRVRITIDSETGSVVYDFEGSGPQMWGNYNCPISICHSAIIYTIRCLISLDIPLNEGCLKPVTIRTPYGSVLNPTPKVAICGSTLASQRVIDVILRAFGRYAASQGCANSLGWGMGGVDPQTGEIVKGWNYGESIGGGVGAGKEYNGEHSTHVHSTNTRQTDAEVIEKRTAVLVRSYGIRYDSGGLGKWRGGDGIRREIQARIPLKFSILSDRRVYRPYGMAGGGPGQKGANYAFIYNEDGVLEKINLGGKAIIHLKEGESIQINTPGGGGYGGDEPDDRHRGYV
ncbi:hydantoinase B/oxoprolinase [Paramyrothecium foliicola]|nr:hydantoinase B/oxoprolinase [Paramyrothecium foliicola]